MAALKWNGLAVTATTTWFQNGLRNCAETIANFEKRNSRNYAENSIESVLKPYRNRSTASERKRETIL